MMHDRMCFLKKGGQQASNLLDEYLDQGSVYIATMRRGSDNNNCRMIIRISDGEEYVRSVRVDVSASNQADIQCTISSLRTAFLCSP